MAPSPRTTAMLVGLLALGSLAAAGLLLPPLAQPQALPVEGGGSPDRVALYQPGLAFVELARTVDSPGGAFTVALPLPARAAFDSVRVGGEGVEVLSLRAPPLAEPLVGPGDEVAVHVEGASFRGTVAAREEGKLVLATAEGRTVVNEGEILAIEVLNVTEPGGLLPGAPAMEVRLRAPEGPQPLQVSYVERGTGWHPVHAFDLDTGRWTFDATITGAGDWPNVTLDLVAGTPHLAPQGLLLRQGGFAVAEGAMASDMVQPSVPLGELHRFRVAEPVNLSQGEAARLPVLEGSPEVLGHGFEAMADVGFGWAAGEERPVEVRERVEVLNTLGEPLPGGTVRFYRNGTWVGEDGLAYVPAEGSANLTVSMAEDVEARASLVGLNSTSSRDIATYELRLTNRRALEDPIEVRAELRYPAQAANLLRAEPQPDEVRGTSVVWTDTLDPGASRSYRITIEQFRPDVHGPIPLPFPRAAGQDQPVQSAEAGGEAAEPASEGAAEAPAEPAEDGEATFQVLSADGAGEPGAAVGPEGAAPAAGGTEPAQGPAAEPRWFPFPGLGGAPEPEPAEPASAEPAPRAQAPSAEALDLPAEEPVPAAMEDRHAAMHAAMESRHQALHDELDREEGTAREKEQRHGAMHRMLDRDHGSQHEALADAQR